MKQFSTKELIIAALKRKGIRKSSFLDEWLDHYMTEYEEAILKGIQEATIRKNILEEINGMDTKSYKKEMFFIYHKKKIMYSVFLSFILSFLFIFNLSSYDEIAEPPKGLPVEKEFYHLTADFGNMMHPIQKVERFHQGIDIAGPIGTRILASGDGVVIESNYNDKQGHYIIIQHDDIYKSKYCHLSTRYVEKGNKVSISDIIGEMGNTGLSTGSHLHYEIIKHDERVNPKDYIKA